MAEGEDHSKQQGVSLLLMASEMEKTSLKHKSIIIGANNTSDENSSPHADKKNELSEFNTVSDKIRENDMKGSRRDIPVIENKTDTCLILKGESSSIPSMIDLHVDDKITSLLSSCTLEPNPILEVKKNRSQEYGSILPARSVTVLPRKKLLILNLNGLLADIVPNCYNTSFRMQKTIRGRTIFKRPFCDEFLKFCFENFDVGIWSSRRKYNVDSFGDYLLGEYKNKLLFCWDESMCTDTGVRTLENQHKQLLLKELKKLWNKEQVDLPWKKGEFSPSNTLLIDNSSYKSLLNPPHTAIFPDPYHYDDNADDSLGPGGDIRVYLEQLLMTDDVQLYVKEHPFGQPAITDSHKDWNFYSKIIKRHSTLSRKR